MMSFAGGLGRLTGGLCRAFRGGLPASTSGASGQLAGCVAGRQLAKLGGLPPQASAFASTPSSLGFNARLCSPHKSLWALSSQQCTRSLRHLWTGGSAAAACTAQPALRANSCCGISLAAAARPIASRGLRLKATYAGSGAALLPRFPKTPIFTGAPAAPLEAGLSCGARLAIAVWLGGCAAWVFSLVVLGGLTRLTRSGLSMTEWKFTGERPPRSQADWEAEFAKYRASPEYRRINRGMSLEEFKFIYWMEYAHRMWGRGLGLAFAGPALFFAARGWLRGRLARCLGLLFLAGGAQGLVGWWMVRSGLQEPAREWEEPRVSPYRLAAHLTSAFVIYVGLLWTALSLAVPLSPAAGAGGKPGAGVASLRRWVGPVAALIALTAFSGAFVAGLDAGRCYNTFPLMSGRLVPEEYWALPGWRNAFENPAAAQLHHRSLALCTLVAVAGLWVTHRAAPLPRPCVLALRGLAAMAGLQVALGISTLLLYVPPGLGAAHQAGALMLLTLALALAHSLRRGPRAAPGAAWGAARLGTPLAAASVAALGAYVAQSS